MQDLKKTAIFLLVDKDNGSNFPEYLRAHSYSFTITSLKNSESENMGYKALNKFKSKDNAGARAVMNEIDILQKMTEYATEADKKLHEAVKQYDIEQWKKE